ncbi:EAL domain-containing protein [Solimonas sp. K1W22B-7]|uniref:EAL domain-containing protein n=1 Tax=Solimonas sp. K1W22B-7 TaxID=2303331 RepID=UPI0013C50E71|nr:GGDEF domain-containing phosphodiesterase [Solimonas sp. K1W22B-7]
MTVSRVPSGLLAPARRWLEGRRSVWGWARYNVYVGLFAFGLVLIAATQLTVRLTIPGDAYFQAGSLVLSGAQLHRFILLPLGGALLVTLALVYLHLVRILIVPADVMQLRIKQDRPQQQQQQEYSREEIDLLVMMARNYQDQLAEARERLAEHEGLGEEAQQAVRLQADKALALWEASSERILEVDGEGVIRGATQAVADLLAISRADLIGNRFETSLQLLDRSEGEGAEERTPMPGLLNAIRSDSGLPRVEQAVLVDRNRGRNEVSITVLPRAHADGSVSSIVRIDPLQLLAPGPPSGIMSASALLDISSGLPNTQAFRQRLLELIKSAMQFELRHYCALIVITGIRDEDDPSEYVRNNIAAAVGRTLRRSLEGVGDVYRIGAASFAMLSARGGIRQMEAAMETARALAQLEVARVTSEQGRATVRYAAVEVNGEAASIDSVVNAVASKLSTQSMIVGGEESLAGKGDDEAERARWVAEQITSERLHLISQSVLPTDPASKLQPWLEVFVRIEDNDGHWIEPGHFLKAVERAGEIDRLDTEVLRRILRGYKDHPELWERYAGISVNVSAISLASDRYLRSFSALLQEYGVAPERIAVEIGSGEDATRLSQAITGLEILGKLGVKLIIDSCTDTRLLRMARQLRPYMVKLSPELLTAAQLDPLADAELQALLTSAKTLGAAIGAKNVDRKSDAERFSGMGIRYFQGRGVEAMGPLMT